MVEIDLADGGDADAIALAADAAHHIIDDPLAVFVGAEAEPAGKGLVDVAG